MAGYTVEERGSRNSLEYRLFIKDGSGKAVSAMHDIPMTASEYFYANLLLLLDSYCSLSFKHSY